MIPPRSCPSRRYPRARGAHPRAARGPATEGPAGGSTRSLTRSVTMDVAAGSSPTRGESARNEENLMSGPVNTTDAPAAVADCSHPAPRAWRSPAAGMSRSGRFGSAVRCPQGPAHGGAPGASPIPWGPPPSPRTAASTSARTRTSPCRPSLGSSTARCCTSTASGSEQVIKPGRLNLMTSGGAVSHAEEATGSIVSRHRVRPQPGNETSTNGTSTTTREATS